MKQVDLLRDVFVWAYERSCQRYMAIRETVAEPDPIRLRYREALIAVVAEIVRAKQLPGERPCAQWRHRWYRQKTWIKSSNSPWTTCAICTKAMSPVIGCGCPSTARGSRCSRQGMMGGNGLRPGWRKVKFGDVVQLSKARCADPLAESIERYVGWASVPAIAHRLNS